MSSVKVIALVGRKRVGKDTAADYLVQYGFEKRSIAAPLKHGCSIMFDLSSNQLSDDKDIVDTRYNATPRDFFKHVGMNLRRQYGEDFWIQRVVNTIRKPTVLCDVRFPNEVAYLRTLRFIEVIVVKIEREESPKEIFENPVDDIDADIVIHNDTTLQDLFSSIDKSFFAKS